MRRIAFVLVGLAVALSAPAWARHTDQADPNDTDGRLDLRRVAFDHFPGRPSWTATTFQRWTLDQIWDTGFVIVELDTRGDEAIDHRLVVGSDGTELIGHLYRVRSDGTQIELSKIGADKVGSRSMSLGVALHKLSIGRHRIAYSWSVLSTFVGSACPQTCFDRVPDEGMVEQPLPGATPTPTPTPSPSPEP